jgi:hypothetical protein
MRPHLPAGKSTAKKMRRKWAEWAEKNTVPGMKKSVDKERNTSL